MSALLPPSPHARPQPASPVPAGDAVAVPLQAPLWQHAEEVPWRLHGQGRAAIGLDVVGGLCFAVLVSFVMMTVTVALYTGGGWGAAIGWNAVWLLAAIACAPVMPGGIVNRVSLRSTVEGVKLDWPELIIVGYYMYYAIEAGLPAGILGPLGLALAVGTAEEFLFRVLVLGWLVTRMRPESALMLSSLVFGAAHLHEVSIVGLLSIVPQTAGGIVLGAIYLRTRNIIGPIIAHAAWDFPLFILAGLGTSGGSTEAGMPTVSSLLIWLVLGVYGLYLVREGVDIAGREGDGVPTSLWRR